MAAPRPVRGAQTYVACSLLYSSDAFWLHGGIAQANLHSDAAIELQSVSTCTHLMEMGSRRFSSVASASSERTGDHHSGLQQPLPVLLGGHITLKDGQTLEYDWLVLALGAETATFGIPGVRELALPFCTFDDTVRVRASDISTFVLM